jgi:GNAT superfamily N-acetyltransferase
MSNIRPAKAEDCEAIHELILELAAFEHLTHQVKADADSLRRALFGQRPLAEALVVEDEKGALFAYAIFFQTYSTFSGKASLYLEDIYVHPDARNRGTGKALLEHVLALARDRDCARCDWLVLDWNENAIRFYENMGASLHREWRLARVTF